METILSIITGLGPFVLLLGSLIFVHELGHYLVAVWCGVRVETFSLGFGKKIFQFKRGPTTYCVSIIPLGGYVKMFGDDPTQTISEADKTQSFLHKPVGQRIAIVLAGPLMNLFFAAIVFGAIHILGEEVPGNKIGDVAPNTAAMQAGFSSGDTIVKIDGQDVVHWKQIQDIIENSPDKKLAFEVVHENSSSNSTIYATPALGKNDFIFTNQRQVGKIEGLGIESAAAMIGISDPQSPAAKMGLKTFDDIQAINDKKITYWRDIAPAFEAAANSPEISITVASYDPEKRKVAEPKTYTIKNTFDFKKNVQASIELFGIERSELYLIDVHPEKPAGLSGLKRGDKIVSVNGARTAVWGDVLEKVKGYKDGDAPLEITVLRDAAEKTFKITPEKIELPTAQGGMESRYAVGIVPAVSTNANDPYIIKAAGVGSVITYGIEKSWEWSKFIAISFVRLIEGEVSPKNIGGVITIGRVANQSFAAGTVAFLKVMAIISINLFLLNLLPVPVLDGGHLVFFTFEAITGAPLSLRKMEIAQQVGLVLLLSLMAFALFNDIRGLVSAW